MFAGQDAQSWKKAVFDQKHEHNEKTQNPKNEHEEHAGREKGRGFGKFAQT